MGKIIGIDLGTSNSAAAVLVGGKPEIIPSKEGITLGGKAFPSVVAFTKDGQRLIGEPARRQAISNPDRTITAIKRKMGTSHKVNIDGKSYTPQEISALILRKIKEDASEHLGEEVTEAIITVPAYFNDNQRQATKDAGRIAGLNVKRLINEPTAAAVAYGLNKEDAHYKIAVLDLGGGTFDVTIMEVEDKVFTVIATAGDTALGGTDMDKLLVDYIVKEFQRTEGMDLSKDSMAMQRVREAAEKAKIELSTTFSTSINLPYVTSTSDGPKHLEMELTRAKLEQLIEPVLNRLDISIKKALADSGLKKGEVEKVILVGGPTRMPSVQKKFEQFFGRPPERSIDPMECVAMGAAIQGGVLTGEVSDLLLLDVTPLTLGVETLGGVMTPLIERNTTIPVERKKVFSTAADNQPAVTINVLQGERPKADQNIPLGQFNLVGIPPAPRGVPQVEVKFDINENGILEVTAKDLATGKSQSIRITAANKMSEDEIQRKIRESEQNAEEDRQFRELTELKNKGEAMVYQTRKLMKETPAFQERAAEIERNITDLEDALKSDNVNRIKTAMEILEKALHEVSAKMYGQQGQQGPGPQGAYQGYQQGPQAAQENMSEEEKFRRATGQDDDVVDVDYT
jgi:molecular chaperone DnaK